MVRVHKDGGVDTLATGVASGHYAQAPLMTDVDAWGRRNEKGEIVETS